MKKRDRVFIKLDSKKGDLDLDNVLYKVKEIVDREHIFMKFTENNEEKTVKIEELYRLYDKATQEAMMVREEQVSIKINLHQNLE